MKISLKLSNPFSGVADSLKSIALSMIQINLTLQKMEIRMATLDTLATDMTDLTSAANGAVMLLQTLAQEVHDLKGSQTDPETAQKIDQLHAQILANTGKLSDALVANTPAEGPGMTGTAQPGAVITESVGGPAATDSTSVLVDGVAGSDTSSGTSAGGTAPATTEEIDGSDQQPRW